MLNESTHNRPIMSFIISDNVVFYSNISDNVGIVWLWRLFSQRNGTGQEKTDSDCRACVQTRRIDCSMYSPSCPHSDVHDCYRHTHARRTATFWWLHPIRNSDTVTAVRDKEYMDRAELQD